MVTSVKPAAVDARELQNSIKSKYAEVADTSGQGVTIFGRKRS